MTQADSPTKVLIEIFEHISLASSATREARAVQVVQMLKERGYVLARAA